MTRSTLEPGLKDTRELLQRQRRQQRERHKFAYIVAKTIALHALHLLFSFFSISFPSSAKQQREIIKFEALYTLFQNGVRHFSIL